MKQDINLYIQKKCSNAGDNSVCLSLTLLKAAKKESSHVVDYVNNVDLDEAAHYKPPYLNLRWPRDYK